MTSFWCEAAWLGADAVSARVRFAVEGGRFVSIETDVDPHRGDTVLAGITLPGLANAHSHAFHRALRGRTHAAEGSFWTWREQMYGFAATLDPDSYHALARATFAEMVMAGITCVGEFHYVHHREDGAPYADPNAMGEALTTAATDAGIRMTLLDTCYLRGGLSERGHVVLSDQQRRFGDSDVGAWIDRVDRLVESNSVKVGASIHSIRAVDPDSMRRVARHCADRDLALHVHVSEQPAENEACLAAYSMTPIELLDDVGALGPGMTAVHATHLTEGDISLLSESESAVCLCPTTERDLADGIGPASALSAAGVRLCVGSDSHAMIDLLEETRAFELNERLLDNVRGHHRPEELLLAATVNGHRSLGWDDAGTLEIGKRADLVSVGLDSVRLAGTRLDDALGSVVFAATAADVTNVVVDGKVVVSDAAHVSIDAAAELDSSIRALDLARSSRI